MRGESDVKKKVKALLNKHEWFWWMPPANGFGKAGTSDFHALRAGVFLAVETKFGSNKPTALQRAFLQSIKSEKALAFVVDDGNIEHFAAWLDAFDRATNAIGNGEKVAPEDGSIMMNAIAAMTEKMI